MLLSVLRQRVLRKRTSGMTTTVRHLPQALKDYLDSKSIPVSHPSEMLALTAIACIGITESGGDNKGLLVELFQSVVSRPLGQSWCLDFIQACVAYVETVTGVASPLPSTELCLALWNDSKDTLAVSTPIRGDIIIWQLGNTIHGHTGLILRSDASHYQTIEGNTSDSEGIDRNGDGVYQKNRSKIGSVTFRIEGFLRPFGG